jgi:hypothetical protein
MVFISAAQLPRSASIEWQVTWQTGQVPWNPDDDDDDPSSDEEPAAARSKKLRKVETQASEDNRTFHSFNNISSLSAD